MPTNNINQIVTKLKQLDLNQQKLIEALIDEINTKGTSIPETHKVATTHIKASTRKPNGKFTSANGIDLSVGDTVRVLNNRKSGKNGDIATIVQFNKQLVAIELQKNQTITRRASKYLDFVPND